MGRRRDESVKVCVVSCPIVILLLIVLLIVVCMLRRVVPMLVPALLPMVVSLICWIAVMSMMFFSRPRFVLPSMMLSMTGVVM